MWVLSAGPLLFASRPTLFGLQLLRGERRLLLFWKTGGRDFLLDHALAAHQGLQHLLLHQLQNIGGAVMCYTRPQQTNRKSDLVLVRVVVQADPVLLQRQQVVFLHLDGETDGSKGCWEGGEKRGESTVTLLQLQT